MNGFLKTTFLSAMIGLGAFSAMPSAALAQNFGVAAEAGSIQLAQHWDRRDRDRDHRPRPGYRGRCTPGEAVAKARAMGLRAVRVVDINRRTVTVRGIGRRGPDLVTFRSDTPNCRIARR
ncbi:hypothetical protein [Limoniibacter endophyticus]|uniref:PepSY domain-containing protein n=1 Tax=Limoniibacter endophyticus TaxID=1565040 RepID=A0A8J3DII3_9HYPH|nr:hypothetical protein [Limoniibacter endophyticus]GHC74890.1 hypothetical protein GCM10010136_24190 [Limoniibacter endophyticus]